MKIVKRTVLGLSICAAVGNDVGLGPYDQAYKQRVGQNK
jgi:hypothetical protein